MSSSNLSRYDDIKDGALATPQLFNSRISQVFENTFSLESRLSQVVESSFSLLANSITSVELKVDSVIGSKIGNSAITGRVIAPQSIVSSHMSKGSVLGSSLTVGGSEVTARRFIATAAGFAVVGPNIGVLATLAEDSLVWKSSYIAGPGSGTSTGFNVGGTGNTAGAYESNTSLVAMRVFSDNTEYAQFHSAGLVVSNSSAPSGGKGSGVKGDIRWASGYIYVCSSTSSWERAALSRF